MTKKKTGDASQPKEDAPIAIPKAYTLISQDEVIDFITTKVRQPKESYKDARRKVRGKVEYAIKTDRLVPNSKGLVVFGDVIRWARRKAGWGEPLMGLPATAVVVPKHRVRNALASDYAVTEKDSDTLLNEAYERINELEGRVGVLQPIVDAQRAVEKRRADRKEQLRKEGRLGGRPPGQRKERK